MPLIGMWNLYGELLCQGIFQSFHNLVSFRAAGMRTKARSGHGTVLTYVGTEGSLPGASKGRRVKDCKYIHSVSYTEEEQEPYPTDDRTHPARGQRRPW